MAGGNFFQALGDQVQTLADGFCFFQMRSGPHQAPAHKMNVTVSKGRKDMMILQVYRFIGLLPVSFDDPVIIPNGGYNAAGDLAGQGLCPDSAAHGPDPGIVKDPEVFLRHCLRDRFFIRPDYRVKHLVDR
jgi:hypothetical protein